MTQICELFVISTVLISVAEVISLLFCHTVVADTHLGACGIGQGDCVK